jgi:(2Fe-2S) ferredoxin
MVPVANAGGSLMDRRAGWKFNPAAPPIVLICFGRSAKVRARPARPSMNEPYYRYHVFFCLNQREGGEACCADHDAKSMRDHAKQRIKELKLAGKGGVRINQAGCLDRCQEGPVIVVYPEGVWYTYVDQEDVDEIIDEHLVNGRVVERLRI